MSFHLPLPLELAEYLGPLLAVEVPPQGTAFQVFIVTAQRGRFVLKVARDPVLMRELLKEASILTVLQEYVPFVAQPFIDAEGDEGHAFLFTCIEGEPLHISLQHLEPQQRHHLIECYAQALRRVHSWTPELPHPTDWLTETLAWLNTNILTQPLGACITNTNSRFDGMDARHVLAELQARRGALQNDMVFGHYDYCLPNVLVQDQQIVGIIDWSGGGYIDRRFDLATALFSLRLAETVQDITYQSTFLRAYGYSESVDSLYFFEALHALTCAFWR